MLVAVASACVVPAIERWGVLVTNLGATVVTVLGALYVLILISLPQLEFFYTLWVRCNHRPTCGASIKHPERNTVLKPIATGPCG